MRMYDIIAKKRDGGTLNHEELSFAVNGYVAGDVPDYQMSALLMAIYLRGMTDEETAMLTDVMAHSGDMVDLSAIAGIKADKHSTGGVGDKTTLVIAPIVAACGVKIAKMSGRGLGHTGGTIDKMEAVPGTRTSLTQEEFFRQVNEIGISVIGQSGKIAVADKKMYALRDVTATVGCIPLIASSIMSKKLAAGMKAGIWFEFEVAGRDEPDCFNKTEWLLTCDGRPITAGDRRFWDMRKPEVQEYLAHRVIDFLRSNGIDYMKVDYNESIGLGCDGAESLGEGLYEQILASQQFFARIRRELPDLVLELCASGGHRLCHSFLELACMASFSDAHECDEIPIIAANMHRMILPRQSQIWAVVKAGQPLQKLYYQICSGLLGRLCFSGEPDALSAAQWTVMDAGTAFYAKAAPIIDHGVSRRFGSRIVSYRAPRGWQAVVRRGETQTLVVVHTFGAAPEAVTLPVGGKITAQLMRDGLTVTHPDGQLTVHGFTDFDAAAFILENEG